MKRGGLVATAPLLYLAEYAKVGVGGGEVGVVLEAGAREGWGVRANLLLYLAEYAKGGGGGVAFPRREGAVCKERRVCGAEGVGVGC